MIQRRQTLYLLTIVILGVVLCFSSVLQFNTSDEDVIQRTFMLSATGMEEITPELEFAEFLPISYKGTWGLMLTTLLIPVLALVDIFLFKKRILQARLNVFLAALCIGYYPILFMYVWFIKKNFIAHFLDVNWSVCFGACVPLVCLVLTIGATRLILKDETMVRHAEHIRNARHYSHEIEHQHHHSKEK